MQSTPNSQNTDARLQQTIKSLDAMIENEEARHEGLSEQLPRIAEDFVDGFIDRVDRGEAVASILNEMNIAASTLSRLHAIRAAIETRLSGGPDRRPCPL